VCVIQGRKWQRQQAKDAVATLEGQGGFMELFLFLFFSASFPAGWREQQVGLVYHLRWSGCMMDDGGLATRMPVLGLTMGIAFRGRTAAWLSFV
jgi:hypothetical protein